MHLMNKITVAAVEQIVTEQGASLVGIQQPLFEGDEAMVLFLFPESHEPHAIPISKFSADEVRLKRRK